ncbi:MAG: Fic family protein [Candidatus Aenigmarchaeota archaeon]|nr:Fic family protein [Candidatus Aenigmarchaeota archaeon]
MVYIETIERGKKEYIYLVHTKRNGRKWEKTRKYIGQGDSAMKKAKREIHNFKKFLIKGLYLKEKQIEIIEKTKRVFDNYKKQAGNPGMNNFNEWFFTQLTYNSNAIEGSTLNLLNTSMIINHDIVAKDTTLREINEAKNHKEALEFLLKYKGDINEPLILKLNSIILKNIYDNAKGKYRKVSVFISGSDIKFPASEKVPEFMKNLVKWYKENKSKLHPLELAVIFSMKFVSIHPFVDGNGRVSRLLMNYILKKKKYPEINIYVKHRNNYIKAVRKANEENYEMMVDFAVKTLVKNYTWLERKKSKII